MFAGRIMPVILIPGCRRGSEHMILSEEERQAAQAKLEEVRAAQTEFWDALFELEELTGLRLCSDVDFEYGRIYRSPYAHAKITGIDTSEAEKLPGVKTVQVILGV